jgi:hypothetical protein
MLKTIHELFRKDEGEEQRGTHIWHDRIVEGRFEMVEEITGENPEKELDQIIKEMRVESSSVLEFHRRISEGRDLHFTGLSNILTFPIGPYPEESRVELRTIGDGTYSWACHMDWERESLEFETVTELKARLRAEDLPLGGNKAELVERLCASDTKHSETEYSDEYLFIDLRVINKKVTRILQSNDLTYTDPQRKVFCPQSGLQRGHRLKLERFSLPIHMAGPRVSAISYRTELDTALLRVRANWESEYIGQSGEMKISSFGNTSMEFQHTR